MLPVSELKDLFRKKDFRPLKRFGENYLIDANIKDKILDVVCASERDVVLEIGPGMGALTMDLARSGADITAVEKDRKAFEILKEMTSGEPKLKLVQGDILEFDIGSIIANDKIKVVGNLPYYITTPIIEYIIDNRDHIELAVVMMQKEVADRVLSRAGDDCYGSLSCFVQYYADVESVYTVGRTSFYPQPEVDSRILSLRLRDAPSVKVNDEGLLFRVIRGSFNQRRKSLINSLSRKEVLDIPKADLAAILVKIGIDPAIRPEMLGLADFASIVNSLRPLLN